MSRTALSKCLETLISSLPPHPVPEDVLERLVLDAIAEGKTHSSTDIRRAQWEYLLKDEVLNLADSEAAFISSSQYYQSLCVRLDIILSFTEHEACDPTFPFTALEDLLETQTIESCSHVFSWIEKRSARLTKGMIPQKGKALVLLRTLNDLLRRLSKTGNTTIFCGRILTFLSAVFPLGERSGVNLRGDYGPQWEDVKYGQASDDPDNMDVDESHPAAGDVEVKEASKTAPGESSSAPKRADDEKQKFYDTFWSLQTMFSRPTLFTQTGTFEVFKSSVDFVTPAVKEATVRERAMMGSKGVGNLKRRRETTPAANLDEGNKDYFFAKYLTSAELLDLEIADTSFRRQFLFQLLILLTHLEQFTKSEKAKWATIRNRSLQMDFTLEADDAKWVHDTINRTYEELRMTTPNGRAFAETVQTILERERNWIRWKNDLCSPFDKEPLSVSLEERAAPLMEKRREPLQEYKHKLGSEALTEIWALGYRDLNDLQFSAGPMDVKDFARDIEKENKKIQLRKQQLAKQAQMMVKSSTPVSAPSEQPTQQLTNSGQPPSTPLAPQSLTGLAVPPPMRPMSASGTGNPLHPSLPAKPGSKPAPVPSNAPPVAKTPIATHISAPSVPAVRPPEATDPFILRVEENKQRQSWLALRTARDEHLHHFGKIGNGDVIMLVQEIEKEAERGQRGDSTGPSPTVDSIGVAVGSERTSTPVAGPKPEPVEPVLPTAFQEAAKSSAATAIPPSDSAPKVEAPVNAGNKDSEADTMAVDS